ncbi:MAG: prolipoprotein diacylglyceryl transferase [Ferrovibrio sp.]|nr:prolipoprotein diacylglyceryl transferase [Ferrovibrio sp.]
MPTLLALPFPAIDPVIVAVGPFAIRWYALSYIAGLILGWQMAMWLARKPDAKVTPEQIDGFLVWATLGVVLGGRLGYVLFYNPLYYLHNPAEILAVWSGGMSFHGGMLGVILAMYLYCRRSGVNLFAFADIIACVAPIGLFFGRIANFINGELWGRVAPDVAWAMVFPTGGPEPRHPSQLYQAAMEGLILFLLVNAVRMKGDALHKPGTLCGLFLVGYGLARIIGEFFRQPDQQLGYFIAGTTMGQWLSLPMVLLGLWLMARARRDDSAAA